MFEFHFCFQCLGAHYNPDNNEHAGPQDLKRHVGDLGKIRSVKMIGKLMKFSS